MRTLSLPTVVACLTLAGAVACGDASNSPVAPPEPSVTTAPSAVTAPVTTLDAQIRAIVNARYPSFERATITFVWNRIVAELAESRKPGISPAMAQHEIEEARTLFLGLSVYLKATTFKVIPPPGETREHVVARLVLLMSLYVYAGPDTPPPDLAPSADAVFAIVQPSATATTTVATPTRHAAVSFPPGSLPETRIVVITQDLTPYPANCSGPLNTRRCQYPQFYDFNVFPDTKLNVPATAAVCHINSGSSRLPLADHGRFRMAHNAPPNAADRVAGGTIVDGIEILPYVEVFGLTSCEGNSYSYSYGVGALQGAPRGALGKAVRWLAGPVERLASALFDRLSPREAYAVDGIGGGLLDVFSPVANVDPNGAPDLAVSWQLPGFEGSFAPGASVPIGSWSVTNAGTATSENVVVSLVVVRDTLTSEVVASVALGTAASLVPGAGLSGSGASVVLPVGIEPGSYYVALRAVSTSEAGIPEPDYRNNRVVAPITVSSPPPVIGLLPADQNERTLYRAIESRMPNAMSASTTIAVMMR